LGVSGSHNNLMTQKEAFKILVSGRNALITGQAGTGKTYLLNRYIKYLRKHKIKVGITASTGIAATHLGGITIHSWAGMGIKDRMSEAEIKKLFKSNKQAIKRIQEAEVLIIDEISMLHAHRLDMVDDICRRVRTDFGPFGGLQVVLCGDFFQLPPVTKGKTRGDFVDKSVVWSQMDLAICYLEKQYRQSEGNDLYRLLNEIRESRVSDDSCQLLSERFSHSFPDGVIPTKLYTHNSNVDDYNLVKLGLIEGEEVAYQMKHGGEKHVVEQMKKGCLAPEELQLKVGAVVMFVSNNFSKGYVNGTTGEVIGFCEETGHPMVRTFRGEEIVAAPVKWGADDPLSSAWIE
jgi:ATP-dependent exoDNAse (exonuclease V) alpha subunit